MLQPKRSTRGQIASHSRESIPWRSSSTVFIFRHIFFCHERTTMTSETSENAIFVRFYFTLFYLTLTSVGKRPCAACHMIWSHACCVSVKKGQWANKALNYQTKMLNSDLNKAITLMKVDQSNYDAKMTSKNRIRSSACPEFSPAVCTLFMPRVLSARAFKNLITILYKNNNVTYQKQQLLEEHQHPNPRHET